MSNAVEIDIALGILDHQLVDSEGRNCGKVDDLELGGLDGPSPEVTEILVGGTAWRGRGRLGRLAARLAGSAVHVPFSEVESITSVVELRRPAAELRLNRGDVRWSSLLSWIPGS
jgi:sporulation protein YlmC with PRC-barrel domain